MFVRVWKNRATACPNYRMKRDQFLRVLPLDLRLHLVYSEQELSLGRLTEKQA